MDRTRARTRATEDAANLRAGVIAAAVSNVFGGKKGGGAFAAKDFFRFDQQGSPALRRDANTPLPPAEQAAVEQAWLNWATAAKAAAERKGLAAAD